LESERDGQSGENKEGWQQLLLLLFLSFYFDFIFFFFWDFFFRRSCCWLLLYFRFFPLLVFISCPTTSAGQSECPILMKRHGRVGMILLANIHPPPSIHPSPGYIHFILLYIYAERVLESSSCSATFGSDVKRVSPLPFFFVRPSLLRGGGEKERRIEITVSPFLFPFFLFSSFLFFFFT
jgi:hypothetical protein